MGSLFSRITNPRRYREHYENEETSTPAGGSNSAAAATSPVAETVEEAAPFDYMPLPKERVATIKGIFGFGQWQGVSIIEWFFVLFYSMVGVIMFLSIVQAMTMGSAGLAILYMVLSPIFFVLLTMAARVFTELVISVLMVGSAECYHAGEWVGCSNDHGNAYKDKRIVHWMRLMLQVWLCGLILLLPSSPPGPPPPHEEPAGAPAADRHPPTAAAVLPFINPAATAAASRLPGPGGGPSGLHYCAPALRHRGRREGGALQQQPLVIGRPVASSRGGESRRGDWDRYGLDRQGVSFIKDVYTRGRR